MSAPNLEPFSIGAAEQMLEFIPSDKRETWVKLGGILKDAFGDAGFGVWDLWSSRSLSYREADARAVWRSLGRNEKRASIGTLVHLARQHGWRRDAEAPARSGVQRSPPPPQKDTTGYALRLWLAGCRDDAVVGAHPYAVSKGIGWAAGACRGIASGSLIGRDADCIIVPIRTDGTGRVQGVQAINASGKKQTFGKITGGCLALGNTLDRTIPWYVAEGWASAVSVVFHHHQGNAVCAAAFGKSNMRAAAELLARALGPDEIVVLREQDA